MPINDINDREFMPILGKIRLGIRKETKTGSQYPSEVEYFVLTDAPEVAKVYGPEPTEIDVIFTNDDLDSVIPTWYRFYAGGFKGKDGKIVGGKLQCKGDGPRKGANGETIPGTASHYAKKDPITKMIPTRGCLGEKCPDWRDAKGNQQCKQAMNVMVMLPRVSAYGVYQIDTTSWRSIRSFWDQLRWVKRLNNGMIRGVPFKIVREKQDIETPDGKTVQKHIMVLQHNPGFIEKFGSEMQNLIQQSFGAAHALPTPEQIVAQPMEDHYVAGELEYAGGSESDPDAKAKTLAEAPEFVEAFGQLVALKGGANNPKARLIAVKKKLSDDSSLGLDDLVAMVRNAIPASTQPVTTDGII